MERRGEQQLQFRLFFSLSSLSRVEVGGGGVVMGITSALVQGVRSSLKEISRLVMRSSTGSDLRAAAAVSPSPWLMLRPGVESGGDMVHRFYSLEDEKVSWVGNMESGRIVGSSHGWLALFNLSNRCLFLTDPVGGGKIDLPSVATLPNSDDWVSRVIISSSPEDEDCRAFMIYGPDRRLAFCAPGLSHKWSPVGVMDGSRRYQNFAYSNTRRTLFCLAHCKCHEWTSYVVESLDLSKADDDDPNVCSDVHFFNKYRHHWPGSLEEESIFKREECLKFYYPVMDEDSDQLYVVVRHVLPRVSRNGYLRGSIYYSPLQGWDRGCAHKTVDFDVYKMHMERKEMTLVDSLDGLAMFVGINHSFAVRPTPTSQLHPNSIYFTDLPDHISWYYTCHDNGIFNHETRTFSSCHPDYPIHLQSVKQTRRSVKEMLSAPLPLWYTPTTM